MTGRPCRPLPPPPLPAASSPPPLAARLPAESADPAEPAEVCGWMDRDRLPPADGWRGLTDGVTDGRMEVRHSVTDGVTDG